jgi:hypothetical protein
MTATLLLDERAVEITKGYALEVQGLVVLRPLSLKEWMELGKELFSLREKTTWAVGDWLVYGDGRLQTEWFSKHGNRGAGRTYTNTYQLAQQITGYSYHTLITKAATSRAFPFDVRLTSQVPWSMHARATALPANQRIEVLQRAADERWTHAQLDEYIIHANHVAAIVGLRPLRGRSARRKKHLVQCPECHHQFVIRGHRVREKE